MKLSGFDKKQKPNPVTQLMLRACIAPSVEEQHTFAETWEHTVDIDKIEFSAMRLVPLFFNKNQQAGITTKHDKRLKVVYKYWWLKTHHIANQLKTVHAAFVAAGIQPVIIKGASLMSYYATPELRPMADFDLMVQPADIDKSLLVLQRAGYALHGTKKQMLARYKQLSLSFDHSIECVHKATGTHLDLHWKIGSFCSQQFTHRMLQNLTPLNSVPGGLKPALEYEVFLIIIHAVSSLQTDNLNWIIDIDVLNKQFNKSFWQKARELAVREKKEGMFDYGCTVLQKHGVYAIPVNNNNEVRIPHFVRPGDERIRGWRLFSAKVSDTLLVTNYLFPYSSVTSKTISALKRVRFNYFYRKAQKKFGGLPA